MHRWHFITKVIQLKFPFRVSCKDHLGFPKKSGAPSMSPANEVGSGPLPTTTQSAG